MKSPMLLWRVLTQELGEWCRVSTSRDLVTASARVEDEGLSFLTITLPSFCSDFEQSLADGKIGHDRFLGFKRNGSLPRFLGGFFALVFDQETGALLDDPSIDAIYAVRQICRFASKIGLPCSKERTNAAYEGFVQVEQELEDANDRISEASRLEFLRVSRVLLGGILSHMDLCAADGSLVPRHGPGKTADKLSGNGKFNQKTWPIRLEVGGFPSVDFLLPNSRFYQNLERVQFLAPEDEVPVKVTAVPKTLKSPRIIAIEPTACQYTQQAVARSLIKEIERDNVALHFIGFTDQEPNQVLAKRGSASSSLATLDLSEASDRCLNSLVKTLFHGYTNLSEAVQACRSTRANVPGHGIIPLTKFASMGSALCFPVEAMVFATIVFVAIQRAQGTKLTREDMMSFAGQVRVYGDDIIVPVEYAETVSSTLEEFAFRVNSNKSFWTGKFRESCGKDYYDGVDVSIVKIRTLIPETQRDVTEVVSTVSLRNQLFKRGFVTTVEYLDKLLERILGYYPEVSETSPVLGRLSHQVPSGTRLNKHTHAPEVRGWVASSKSPRNEVDGEGALLKFFLNADAKNSEKEIASIDKDHLRRSGRPVAVNITLQWAPV